jgi:lantibiotic modifying enzyme
MEGPGLEHEFDLMFGKAGAIAGLLALRERDMLDEPSLTSFAVRLAGMLLQSADKSKAGYSWKARPHKQVRNLTGLSHGTAGVAYALLELYQVTGDEQYRQAAEMAFAYERAHFEPSEGNWPDFRDEPGRIRRGKRFRQYMTAWCHGAPGIALGRLGGLPMLSTLAVRRDLATAVQTTLDYPPDDADHVCCGNLGRVEVLLAAGQRLRRPELIEAAHRRGAAVVATAARNGRYRMPIPLPEGFDCFGFFNGIAGVGYELLRLANPHRLPSVLLWE